MSDDSIGEVAVNEKLRSLVLLLANPPEQWGRHLPRCSAGITYLARETPLSSSWALFAVAYELWFLLNSTGLDRANPAVAALRQLRILVEILWDAGTVQQVNWDVGNADRWDDYWHLLHRLATEVCDSFGWNTTVLSPVDLTAFESVICAKT